MKNKAEIVSKITSSTTLAIVIFAMLNLISHVVLMFVFEKEISYMGDMVSDTFEIFIWYIVGNKGANIAKEALSRGKK